MDSQTRRFRRLGGQALIMLTLALVPLFGMIGLVTDFGYMHFIKMSAQTAAEAAAQAAIIDFHASNAGSNYTCGSGGVVCAGTATTCASNITTPANSLEHGCMYAQKHGFNGSNQWVTYQAGVSGIPATVSGVSAASYWVTFIVMQKVPTMFSAVLGNMSSLVAARSSAALLGASDCIFALSPNASGAVNASGTAAITSACGIMVDSSSASALSTNGTATISAPEYDVHGGVSTHSPLSPTPNTGVAPVSDPLAGLAAPASAPYHCDYINYNAASWSNPTLSPGVYCGGINVKNNVYTLTTGTYILVGGGLSTQNSNSFIVGNGVTFYNTYGTTTNSGTYTYSPINLSANSGVTLTAPNTGTYAGILIFEDRGAAENYDTYGGGSTAVYQGVIYAPHADITMYGNSSVNCKYTMVVANTVSLVGTTAFNNDYSLLPTGSPIQRVVLLE